MAFRKKFEKILSLNPDLIVLQECEQKHKIQKALSNYTYNQIIWYGNNVHKGVAIISFKATFIELSQNHNLKYDFIIPIKLVNQKKIINLFGIWAMPNKTDKTKGYIGQIWEAINYYSSVLKSDSILIGDFNSNAIWDKKRRIGNHTDVVNFLDSKNIISIYHENHKCLHGEEPHPTLYLHKNLEKPYHIDYCFVSSGSNHKYLTA